MARLQRQDLMHASVILALASGLIHLFIGAAELQGVVVFLFVGIAIVYFVGAGLIMANVRRSLWMGIGAGWVALLLASWVPAALRGGVATTPLAYLDKVIELLLLFLLIIWHKLPDPGKWKTVNSPADPV